FNLTQTVASSLDSCREVLFHFVIDNVNSSHISSWRNRCYKLSKTIISNDQMNCIFKLRGKVGTIYLIKSTIHSFKSTRE
ncbi:unnamed protein product, partial [Larinioides sclopetarius]